MMAMMSSVQRSYVGVPPGDPPSLPVPSEEDEIGEPPEKETHPASTY